MKLAATTSLKGMHLLRINKYDLRLYTLARTKLLKNLH